MNKKDETLKSKIYNALLEDIIKGEYKSHNIINEKGVIEKYMVSKSPVRDALVMMCNEGILKSIPRYGYEIVKITLKDINNIIEFRYIIENQSIKKILDNASQSQKSELEILLENVKKETQEADIFEHWKKNTQFHLKLNEFANNKYIYNQLEKSLNTLKRAYAQFHWQKWQKTDFTSRNMYHARILEQIIVGNYEKACDELLKDSSYFKCLVKDLY